MRTLEAIFLKKVGATFNSHLQCLMRNIGINYDRICES